VHSEENLKNSSSKSTLYEPAMDNPGGFFYFNQGGCNHACKCDCRRCRHGGRGNCLHSEGAHRLLADFPGIIVMDKFYKDNPRLDPFERTYPTALDLRKEGLRDATLVGRIREDPTIENGLNIWCVSDNLRKGAALNVVQIWEIMLERNLA
jgi:hypothetical protein